MTVKFSSPQYTNLQYIGNVYIVPQSIWSSVGDPATYIDANPVGTGPYTFGTFSPSGITLKANPSYWGGAPKVSEVDFPVYASNNTVLPALTTNQLDWAGNFLSGLQAAFIKPDPTNHHVWFAAGADEQSRAEPDRLADEPAGRSPGDQPRDRPHGDQHAG